MNKPLQTYFSFFVIMGILLNATGLVNPILEPDGTLYATISKHMALTNDWVNLVGDNHDWLDKPHFPFWITALSYKIFGINSFAYKIPAFIFWLLGLRFTYLLAKGIYNAETARASVLIYLVALHTVLANFDVRAEPYLTTLTIGSIYYFYLDHKNRKWTYLIAAAFLAACAVMTKGIFALIGIGGGFVICWMISGQWKQFINPRWWLLLILIFIFILPELYCLYQQFDIHPEKVVFDRTGVSGLRFFFWDSQFGRFFNTGPIKGSGDISFFLHTMLWAFLPWSIFFYMALFTLAKNYRQRSNREQWIIYGSAGLTFLLFSFSSFQLPHYVVIFFPQCSIITGAYLLTVFNNGSDRLKNVTRAILFVVLVIAALLVSFLSFFTKISMQWVICVACAIVIAVTIFFCRKTSLLNSFGIAYAFSIILYPFLNFFFYPMLFQYQAGLQAARWLQQNSYGGNTAMYRNFSHAFEFYTDGEPLWIYDTADLHQRLLQDTSLLVYTEASHADTLKQMGFHVNPLRNFEYFRISMLTGDFLNPATRNGVTTKMVIARVSNKR